MAAANAQDYYSNKSNNSYTSGNNGGKKKIGQLNGKVKKTLTINDYKKFKRIKDINSRYLFGKTLGQGAFGTVRLCMHKDS